MEYFSYKVGCGIRVGWLWLYAYMIQFIISNIMLLKTAIPVRNKNEPILSLKQYYIYWIWFLVAM